MDAKLILNVWIAMMLYNLILKAIGAVIMERFLDSNPIFQKEKKSFNERLAEKAKQRAEELKVKDLDH